MNRLIENLKPPRVIRLEMAERFRKVRLAQNLSQKDVAQRSGVSLASVRKFETTGDRFVCAETQGKETGLSEEEKGMKVSVFLNCEGERRKVGMLDDEMGIRFQYTDDFVDAPLPLSPVALPISSWVW